MRQLEVSACHATNPKGRTLDWKNLAAPERRTKGRYTSKMSVSLTGILRDSRIVESFRGEG
jgi:hypothetical protein